MDFKEKGKKAIDIFHENENIIETTDYLNRVIEKYPDEAEAYITKAMVLDYLNIFVPDSYKKANKEATKQACIKAIELDPNHIKPYNILGGIYSDENLEKAKECYEKALQIDNNDCDANSGMANYIAEAEGIERAIEYCNELIERNPNDINFYEIKFNLIAFYVDFEATEDTKTMLKREIIELFNKLVKDNPNESSYYGNLGLFYENFEDYNATIDICSEALNKFPDEREFFEEEIENAKELIRIKAGENNKGEKSQALKEEQNFQLIMGIIIVLIAVIGFIISLMIK